MIDITNIVIFQVMPVWLTTSLLTLLLALLSVKLVGRGLITWRKETEAKAKESNRHSRDAVEQPLLADADARRERLDLLLGAPH